MSPQFQTDGRRPAHRAELRRRLIAEGGLAPQLAEQWVRAWEVEGGERGLDPLTEPYWQGAFEWIAAQRRPRRVG